MDFPVWYFGKKGSKIPATDERKGNFALRKPLLVFDISMISAAISETIITKESRK